MDLRGKIQLALVTITLSFLTQGNRAHLLPQALEDVHSFVQGELNQGRSHHGGRMSFRIDTPPQGGPAFQTTTTYIGTPVVIQKEVSLNGKRGLQKFMEDLNFGASQIVVDRTGPSSTSTSTSGGEGLLLARGLVPPAPMIQQGNDEQTASASTQQAQIIPANLVGPSTFVQDAPLLLLKATTPPQIILQREQQQQLPVGKEQQQLEINSNSNTHQKTMDGWVPIDKQGTRVAKAVALELQTQGGGESPEIIPIVDNNSAFKNIGYSPRQSLASPNDVDSGATTVQVDNLIIGTNSGGASSKLTAKYPVYPGNLERNSAKVVIHAQNVIIRDNNGVNQEGSSSASSVEDENVNNINGTGNTKQFQAYSQVPQLNHFLRDQLRIAAMNQLIQSQLQLQSQAQLPGLHPLADKAFPRPLSLREIAQAARNGQFPPNFGARSHPPPPGFNDPLLGSSSLMSFSIPHFVRMRPDARPLPSIQSQSKVPFPGGLRNIYQNLFQNSGPPPSSGFDPREPLDYSLLSALSGQRQKPNSLPPSLFKTSRPDYGDSVGYNSAETPQEETDSEQNEQGEKGKVPPIKIISAEPASDKPRGPPPPSFNPQGGGSGSLSQISDDLLKELIIQELDNSNSHPLLPSSNPFLSRPGPGGGPPRGRRPRPSSYGSNGHPFAYLNNGPDSSFQESFNPYGSAGPSGPDTTSYFLGGNDDDADHVSTYTYEGGPPSHSSSGSSSSSSSGYEDDDGSSPGIMPLTKDTMISLGKSLFHQALDFSKQHNPMTFIQRVRKLPPVKFELYKMPVGIPEGMLDTLQGKQRGGRGGGPGPGPGPGPEHGPRPRGRVIIILFAIAAIVSASPSPNPRPSMGMGGMGMGGMGGMGMGGHQGMVSSHQSSHIGMGHGMMMGYPGIGMMGYPGVVGKSINSHSVATSHGHGHGVSMGGIYKSYHGMYPGMMMGY
ncbi:unnamed protein product [Orchesella dallaii]|uniref:Uncharacterized protein n=1 Tax=Orchesella dallaii TaxID=48710 RepID=A0ABP1RUP8_9HEXA